jgi:hypothetical protein
MARTGGSRYDILLLCVKDGRSVQGSKADMRKVGPSKIEARTSLRGRSKV